MEIAGRPRGPVAIPAVVLDLAAGRDVEAVWRNNLDGITFEIAGRAGLHHVFVKVAATGDDVDLADEARRLGWARSFTPVPEVLDSGRDDEFQWLVTRAVAGTSAVAERWIADPAPAVRAIGEGLRALHDRLPVEACPFDWSIESRVRRAAAKGIHVPESLLEAPPPDDHPVVCHGDACAPNTLLDEDGRFTAHVDLGSLGVADRWADLAVASWSLEWNYGPGWDDLMLDAYGIEPDPARIHFYRRLWDAT
ncbi:phosphotransferase [Amnibacterium flavum]|uniref:Aminoglycoside phosphotransferase APH(3') n=1 Tax=Amnibacterium flavum TaxID=2173173 RepID=A0A2V1HU73_9MICO|nr:aminoglycoside 3'-phosphotransferase [Amnibacterium flavum]PVZ96133.1 aminoglycoside phosphotransferase APH(3') [Amnibacterium flavum]